MTDPLALAAAFAAAFVAGVVNSVAGGGTLITFPVLVALGLGGKAANVTSTVGLWPGTVGGAWGYRREVGPILRQFLPFFVPSLLGGLVGGGLLLATPEPNFDDLVPWLILGATVLFAFQGWIKRTFLPPSTAGATQPGRRHWLAVVAVQFAVSVYGGYFGAGIGILMLAALGLLGLTDIHQMNGVKNIAGACINGVAVLLFIAADRLGGGATIHWPMAAVMALGALLGGYASAGLARRLDPRVVRGVVVAVGLLAAAWTAVRAWAA